MDKFDAFMDEYYEHCGPIAKTIKNIGTFFMVILTIICLVSYIKDGDGIGSIVGSLFVLWTVCGFVLIAITIVIEVITRAIRKK